MKSLKPLLLTGEVEYYFIFAAAVKIFQNMIQFLKSNKNESLNSAQTEKQSRGFVWCRRGKDLWGGGQFTRLSLRLLHSKTKEYNHSLIHSNICLALLMMYHTQSNLKGFTGYYRKQKRMFEYILVRNWGIKQEEKDKDCPVVAMVNGR